MDKQEINKVAIAGAGTMGSGMAQVAALAGNNVILFDLNLEAIEKAKLIISNSLNKLLDLGKINKLKLDETFDKIIFSSEISEIKADLVIEAIIEKPEPKIELFKKLMEINGENTIYASNTSSIPISLLAASLPYSKNFIGIHFFNPAQIMKLVEVINGAKTNIEVTEKSINWIKKIGKTPVVCKDSPGFIVNRIARLYYVEALKILEEGLCEFHEIDELMESLGFKMGPFKLMDLIGVDTNYSVTESQYNLFNHEARFRPSRIQKQKVDAGLWGKKTKEGFYKYE